MQIYKMTMNQTINKNCWKYRDHFVFCFKKRMRLLCLKQSTKTLELSNWTCGPISLFPE